MIKKDLTNQTKDFIDIWHKLIHINENQNLDKMFPNFSSLSTNEIGIISIVAQNDEVILGDIGKALNLPKSTLTNTINRLEKKGFIHRKISQTDLRSYGLSLTEKGLNAENEHLKYENLIFGSILKSLNSDEERNEFLKLLNTITTNLYKGEI